MNFYTQVLIELIGALGAAMAIGNVMAILRRKRDRDNARENLQHANRASRQTSTMLAKKQIKEGKATLAVAPLWRSITYVVIGTLVFIWAVVSRFS